MVLKLPLFEKMCPVKCSLFLEGFFFRQIGRNLGKNSSHPQKLACSPTDAGDPYSDIYWLGGASCAVMSLVLFVYLRVKNTSAFFLGTTGF